MTAVRTALGVASLCVALASCSSGTGSSPQPGNGTALSATSASSTSDAQSRGPGASATPTAQSTDAFCAALLNDQRRAGEAIAAAILHPTDKLTLDDLQAARAKLQADWLLAPADLKTDVRAQIATMDDVIRGIRSGTIKGLDPRPFNEAQKRLQSTCSGG